MDSRSLINGFSTPATRQYCASHNLFYPKNGSCVFCDPPVQLDDEPPPSDPSPKKDVGTQTPR